MRKNFSRNRNSQHKDGILLHYIHSIMESVNKSKSCLLVLLAVFLLAAFTSIIDYATRNRAVKPLYTEYEVGQISDITVVAKRTIIPVTTDGLVVRAGEKIIRKGFPITEEAYEKLKIIADEPSKMDFKGVGRTVLFLLLLVLVALLSFKALQKNHIFKLREAVFLGALFILVYCLAALMVNTKTLQSPFYLVVVIPAALCTMLITILINIETANCFSLIFAMGSFVATSYNPVVFLFVLISSLISARLVCKMEKRIDFIYVSFILAFLDALVLFVLWVIFPRTSANIAISLVGIAFNGFISGVLVLGFLTPLESLLNAVTVFRLMDLSDLNTPIMKHLMVTAPGTYSHSMMVATLAESACREINANPLLARVGAYYHDLGKLEQPEYFVENQGAYNKHDELNPRLSASIIRRHVKKGVEKAHQLHLPQEVIDIIAEHHGNGIIAYFYNEAKKLDESISPDEFSYPGNPPSTKESAVVMLADTVEAACRTLEKPSVPRLEKFIRQLVMKKYEDRQLDKSTLTFKEVDTIQEVFVNTLASYYHSRIEYPNQKDPDQNDSNEKGDEGEKQEKQEKKNESKEN
ncbi:MAG: HDIG domain-containing protein [Spirochaetaceae bacterium]|nr:HDIG domain-containing protein [Spirochaetaceae bacterium]